MVPLLLKLNLKQYKMKKEALTAYHEAGHVAASLYYQHPFKYVTITPNNETLGFVMLPGSSKRIKEIINWDHQLPEMSSILNMR